MVPGARPPGPRRPEPGGENRDDCRTTITWRRGGSAPGDPRRRERARGPPFPAPSAGEKRPGGGGGGGRGLSRPAHPAPPRIPTRGGRAPSIPPAGRRREAPTRGPLGSILAPKTDLQGGSGRPIASRGRRRWREGSSPTCEGCPPSDPNPPMGGPPACPQRADGERRGHAAPLFRTREPKADFPGGVRGDRCRPDGRAPGLPPAGRRREARTRGPPLPHPRAQS